MIEKWLNIARTYAVSLQALDWQFLGEIRSKRLKSRIGISQDISHVQKQYSHQFDTAPEEYINDYVKKNASLARCHKDFEESRRGLVYNARETHIELSKMRRKEEEEIQRQERIAALSKWENSKNIRLRNEVIKSIVINRVLRSRHWFKVIKFMLHVKAIRKYSQQKISSIKLEKKRIKQKNRIVRMVKSVMA